MESQSRRSREKQEMKTAILEAASEIILKEGYEKLSMRKLANAIEYTPTTIYGYYKDKSQIIEDILKELYLKIVSDIKEVLQKNSALPIDTCFVLALKSFINTLTNNAAMGRALMMSEMKTIFEVTDAPAEKSDDGMYLLQSLLHKGMQQSVFRRLDENVPWMIITALLGFSMNAIENQLYLNENWDSLVDTYVEILLKGILHA